MSGWLRLGIALTLLLTIAGALSAFSGSDLEAYRKEKRALVYHSIGDDVLDHAYTERACIGFTIKGIVRGERDLFAEIQGKNQPNEIVPVVLSQCTSWNVFFYRAAAGLAIGLALIVGMLMVSWISRGFKSKS